MNTAAVLLIGDEILAGKYRDENGIYAIQKFREHGIALKYLGVIPDEFDVISAEVARCHRTFDVVVTSGGVGPTHDDITLEAVADAFNVPLETHDDLLAAVKNFGWELTDAVMRMVRVPQGTQLNWREGLRYPIIQMRNVYMLPGVPSIFQMKLDALLPNWSGPPLVTDQIYVSEREAEIAQRLAEIAARHRQIAIGSYPRFESKEYRVVVTLEGTDAEALHAAREEIVAVIKTVKPKMA